MNISDQTIKAIRKVLKLFLPAWYLPNGKINATEVQLEGVSSSCEQWGIWCGALVVISVIAEFVIAWVEPPYNSFLKESLVPDAGIAIGIVGEVLFGMWNNRIQTELRSRSNKQLAEAVEAAGQANARAAEANASVVEAQERTKLAELEIAKLKAPRQITSEGVDHIAAILRPLGGFPYDLSIPTLLEPGSPLINGLVLALRKSGLGIALYARKSGYRLN